MQTRRLPHGGLTILAVVLCVSGPVWADDPALPGPVLSPSEETPFLDENAAAMNKMMAGMNVAPTGDVDVDFTAMMIPHHQGAIDMAVAYLRYGRNEQLRRLAQEIIVEQQQEIAAMRLAIGQSLPPSVPVPTEPGSMPSPATNPSKHDHSAMQKPTK